METTWEPTRTRTQDGTIPIGTLLAAVVVIASVLALLLVAVSPSASANLGIEGDDWPAPHVPDAEGAKLGSDLAIHGDTVIAGAPGEGAVYVYERTRHGWERQAKLTPPEGQGDGSFGYRVGIDGDRLAVAESGNVHLYEETREKWALAETIQGPHESFGTGLALDGDRLAVGAHKVDTDDWNDGVVFVYDYEEGSWTQTARIEDHGCQQTHGSEKCGNHRFGARDIALRDDLLVAAGVGGNGELHLYRHEGSGWELSKTVEGLNDDDHLGMGGLSLSGDWLLAGAKRGNEAGDQAGYVLALQNTGDGWSVEQTLTASDADPGDRFGDVAHHGHKALVGAFWDDEAGTDAGAVYGFELVDGRWEQTSKATRPNASANDRTGAAVALTGETAAVGSYLADTEAGEESGAVYVFPRDYQPQGPTLIRDGFEDGTVEDPWTLTLDGAAEARILEEPVHRGSYVAQLASGCGGDDALGEARLDHRLEGEIESGETFSTWIRPVEFGGYGVWGGIQLLDTTHKSAVTWKLSTDGFEYRIVWPDGSHEVRSFGSWDVGNWYRINVTFDPETETVTFGASTPEESLGQLQAHDVPLAFDRLSLVSNPGGQQDNCGTYVFDDASYQASSPEPARGEEPRFQVSQAGESFKVTPLSNGQTAADFYGDECDRDEDGPAGDLAQPDTTLVFFWEGPDGTSLVFMHDKTWGDTGGSVDLDLTGEIFQTGTWRVTDDCGRDGTGNIDFGSQADPTPTWHWSASNADGGAWQTNFTSKNGTIRVGEFSGMSSYIFLSGNPSDPRKIPLDPSQPLRLAGSPPMAESGKAGDGRVYRFDDGLEGWSTGLHPCKEGARVGLGGAEWSSEHGGSLELVADGAPSGGHAWIPFDEVDALKPGAEVRVEYASPDIEGEPGNVQIRLWRSGPFDGEPECSGYKLDGDQGRPDHANATVDGVLAGTIPEEISNPEDFDLVVKTVVWPGEFTVYVEDVSVAGPDGPPTPSTECPPPAEIPPSLCERLDVLQRRVQALESRVQTLDERQQSLEDRIDVLEAQRTHLVRLLENRLNLSAEEVLGEPADVPRSGGVAPTDHRGRVPTVSTSENASSANATNSSQGTPRQTPSVGAVGMVLITAAAGIRWRNKIEPGNRGEA